MEWWLIAVLGGTVLGGYPHTGSFESCQARAVRSTVQGQMQRVAAGLPVGEAYAICVEAREQPQPGDPAPRQGVQL
jgi:hypothetical protein